MYYTNKLRELMSIFLFLLITFSFTSIEAANYDNVFKFINQYRNGKNLNIKIEIKNDFINFLIDKKINISKKQAEKILYPPLKINSSGEDVIQIQKALNSYNLLDGPIDGKFGHKTQKAIKQFQKNNNLKDDGVVGKKTWSKILPTVTRTKKFDDVIYLKDRLKKTYRINSKLEVEENIFIYKNNKTKWSKIEYRIISRFHIKQWQNFLKKAISNGLVSYDIVETENLNHIELSFKRKNKRNINVGNQQLILSDNFYSNMKISKKFAYKKPASNNFVIIVHEPHSNILAQYQLVEGLKSLLNQNSKYEYRFLIEGDLLDDSRDIPCIQLNSFFSKDKKIKKFQVYELLRRFVIDGPMAYRLLYNENIPAIAIDDPVALSKTPSRPKLDSRSELISIYNKIKDKMLDLRESEKETISQVLYQWISINTIVYNLEGKDLVAFLKEKLRVGKVLLEKLKQLDNVNFKDIIGYIDNHVNKLKDEVVVLQNGLIRDSMMADYINKHYKSKYGHRIPVVFIGNFHTPGIIQSLNEDIGYIVIEPLGFITTNSDELRRFKESIEDYDSLIQSLSRHSRKLRVSPSEKHFNQISSYLNYLENNLNNIHHSSNVNVENSALYEKMLSTVIENPCLNNAQIQFDNGGNNNIPPTFNDAFAAFFPSSNDGSFNNLNNQKKLLLFTSKGNLSQSDVDKINFLSSTLITPPLFELYAEQTTKVSFYQDESSKKLFCTLYDPKSKGYYFFDSNNSISGFDFLKIPVDKKENSFRMNLTFLQMIIKTKRG